MDVRLPGNVENQARSHGIFLHSLAATAPADSYGKTAVHDVPSRRRQSHTVQRTERFRETGKCASATRSAYTGTN